MSEINQLCGDFTKTPNENGDYLLPEGLRKSIIKGVHNNLFDLQKNIVVVNQFKTYLSQVLDIVAIHGLSTYIKESIVQASLNIWDEGNIENIDSSFSLDFSDEEFMDSILYISISNFINDGGNIGKEETFTINGIPYQYNDYIISKNQIVAEDIKPKARPNWSPDELYEKRLEGELYSNKHGKNQFEKIEESGLGIEIEDFINNSLFQQVCRDEDFECTEKSFKNIQNLILFVSDCETTQGTALRNNDSNSSGLFHIMNQDTSSRSEGIYNTVDTMLREVSMDWYGLDLNSGEKVEELGKQSDWLKDIWKRNGETGKRGFEGRDGDEYTTDDQIRIFLGRTSIYRKESLQVILNPNSTASQLQAAAVSIYGLNYGSKKEDLSDVDESIRINVEGKINNYFPT